MVVPVDVIVYQDEHLITGTFLPMLGIDGFRLHAPEESLRGAVRRMALLRFCKLASTVGLACFVGLVIDPITTDHAIRPSIPRRSMTPVPELRLDSLVPVPDHVVVGHVDEPVQRDAREAAFAEELLLEPVLAPHPQRTPAGVAELPDRVRSAKAGSPRPTPYLLTGREAALFLRAAGTLESPSPWAWQSRAFFMLMACCGLRTREVRRLAVGHVDHKARSIDVVDSKAGRSRRLPVGDEVAAELLECDQRSRERFGDDRPAFFVTSTGNPVSPGMPGVVFRRVWTRAGLEWPQAGKRPRPYDFRHRFAFANIERWTRDSVDVMAMLPYLAAYMGHAGIDSTLYYVHASPDFMDGYADLVADAERVVPETEEP